MNAGDEVTITGCPERYTWMRELIGQKATIEAKGNGYLLSGLPWPKDPIWLGEAYLQSATKEDGEEAA